MLISFTHHWAAEQRSIMDFAKETTYQKHQASDNFITNIYDSQGAELFDKVQRTLRLHKKNE